MQNLTAEGVTTCTGGVFDTVDLKGVIKVSRGIVCRKMNVDGVCTISGCVEAGDVRIAGTCKTTESVKAGNLDIYGVINVAGDVQCERMDIDGALDVGGTLNADVIRLVFAHGSSAKEVCGRALRVTRKSSSVLLHFIRPRKNEFTANSIECDEISLEYSAVGTVSGARVAIGPKCRIGRLEYTESYTAHPTAVIEKIEKRGAQV